MKIGYVRVSTVEQNTARQDVLMSELGVDKVYIDKQTGKNTERPALNEMLTFAREGDVVVVESFSRLARSTRDFLGLVDEFEKKGISFVSKKENIDTSTPQGKFMLTVFAALAQLERETILQRQAEGIAIKKAQGGYKGRAPKKIDEQLFVKCCEEIAAGVLTPTLAAKKLEISRSTFYRRWEEYKTKIKQIS